MSDSNIRPEDHPRYLAPVEDFKPPKEEPTYLEAQINHHQALLATFSTEGWKTVKKVLEARRDSHIEALTLVTGATEIAAIFGLRQGLALLEMMLGLEDKAKQALKQDSELLYKIRNREEK